MALQIETIQAVINSKMKLMQLHTLRTYWIELFLEDSSSSRAAEWIKVLLIYKDKGIDYRKSEQTKLVNECEIGTLGMQERNTQV